MANFKHLIMSIKLLFILLVSFSCQKNNSDPEYNRVNSSQLKIREIKCLDYDTLDLTRDIVFVLDYRGENLPKIVHAMLDSIVCMYVDSLDKKKQPPVVAVIKETKFTRQWGDAEIMRNSEHLYSNKLYFFAKYSWNVDGNFISKVDNDHNVLTNQIYCSH